MKKLMFAAALATVCGAVQAEPIASDIVGYNQTTLTKKRYTLVGIPWDKIDKSETSGFMLNELPFTNVLDGNDVMDGDVVQFWSGTGWKNKFYHDTEGWWDTTDKEFDEVYPDGLPNGTPFFYYSRNTESNAGLNLSGMVADAADKTYTLTKKRYTLIANPYPVSYDIDENLLFTNVLDGNDIMDGDVVQFWSGTGWKNKFYHDTEGWWDTTDKTFDEVYPNGAAVGQPFFYYSRNTSNATVKFTNPVATAQ